MKDGGLIIFSFIPHAKRLMRIEESMHLQDSHYINKMRGQMNLNENSLGLKLLNSQKDSDDVI